MAIILESRIWLAVLLGIAFQFHLSFSQLMGNTAQSSTSKDWRCAIFLMPASGSSNSMIIPQSPVQVWTFPTAFKASCATPSPASYNRTCYEIMKLSFNRWSYMDSSKLSPKSGSKIGDDFCRLIQQDEYEGREVGFFFNFCGRNDWIDTTLRRKEKVCCRNGKYVSCPPKSLYGY